MSNDKNVTLCKQCGYALNEIDKYCPNCGTKISGSSNKGIIIAFCIIGFLILANITALIGMVYQIKNRQNANPHPRRIQALRESEIDNSVPADFREYMRKMQTDIKMNWNPPSGDKSASVTLKYTISKDGNLVKYSVLESSGNPDLDEAAINALKYTAPFDPLPDTYKKDTIEVQFKFDYNVYRK